MNYSNGFYLSNMCHCSNLAFNRFVITVLFASFGSFSLRTTYISYFYYMPNCVKSKPNWLDYDEIFLWHKAWHIYLVAKTAFCQKHITSNFELIFISASVSTFHFVSSFSFAIKWTHISHNESMREINKT